MTAKLVKWILIALAVCLALGIAYAVVRTAPGASSSGVVVFVEKEPTDIQTLSIANQYGSYQVFAEDGGYTVGDIPANIIEVEGFYELMYHSCAFGALRRIEAFLNNR